MTDREAEVRLFPEFAVQPQLSFSSVHDQWPRESKDSKGSSTGWGRREAGSERGEKEKGKEKGEEKDPALGAKPGKDLFLPCLTLSFLLPFCVQGRAPSTPKNFCC